MVAVLLNLPLWISTLLTVGGAAAFAAGVTVLIRRYVPHERVRENNDVAGFIYAVLGLIYGVVLAFVVLFAFENFHEAKRQAETEAGSVVDLYRLSAGYPKSFGEPVRRLISEYMANLVDGEWESMTHGRESVRGHEQIRELWLRYSMFEPTTLQQQALQQASIQQLGDLADYRRLRLLNSRTSLPAFMWFVMILGALITLSFSFLFGAPNVKAQATMSALLASMISLTLFLVLQLDHVYTGRVAVSQEPFRLASRYMENPSGERAGRRSKKRSSSVGGAFDTKDESAVSRHSK